MSKTARDVMSGSAECVQSTDTVLDAARKLARAEGKDPAETQTGELGEGKPVTIGADDSVEEALRTMIEHKVRRLPVIDGHDLIGIVSQADLAQALDNADAGELVEAISAA